MIQAGDVLFYHADLTSPIDRAIVAAQAAAGLPAWCSHVALAISDRYLVEAVRPTVRASALRLRYPAAWATPAYTGDGMAATDRALAAIGTPYGTLGVAAFGMGLVLPGAAELLAEVTRALDAQTLWCSQEVAEALLAAGIALDVPPARCAPGHLVRAFDVAEPR